MTAPKEILALVERFHEQRDAYQSGKYNETQLRREFLDPFFKALGWDVDNEQGYAEAYKDVVHEDAIKVGGWTKAPDYAFRIGGVRKFFVEAKKPSVDIKGDVSPAFQLRRYAWSAKLPLSILTDFEEFAVYDCRVRPDQGDKSSAARLMYVTFEEYAEQWGEIADVFSREAVLKGSFDRFAESKRKKRGTAEVDEAFLGEIEGWRDALARSLALRNEALSQRELNFAVQRIIDRVIFLRICEDRGIETYGQLQALVNGVRIYDRLTELFHRADDRYNSGLFHFRKEKGRHEAPDELTLGLTVDDKVLKEIIGGLYYPASPYEFSVLPGDILGQVYEQFLGKVIRLTAGHHAKVEDKPEVKKAGGVYYTPTYIVDYIVEQTVGTLLEGKTPKHAASLKILDPACGSGSFLLGTYQKLLDWHRDWYVKDGPPKHKKELYQGPGGVWRLTSAQKKRILLNSIYGVDIDSQAVEVTKLSLLLKVLEGESAETIQTSLRLFHERALPDLGDNIKCGNSLIGPDFYDDKQMELLDEEDRYRINVFDWDQQFKSTLHRSRAQFDSVIGNPPYVLLQVLNQPDVFKYLAGRFATAQYKIDTYHLFLELAVRLTAQRGRIGFITPTSYLRNKYAHELRTLLLRETAVQALRIFYFQVFKDATVDTAITISSKELAAPDHRVAIVRSKSPSEDAPTTWHAQDLWRAHPDHHFGTDLSREGLTLMRKIREHSVSLGTFATAYFGIQTFDRSRYVSSTRGAARFKPVVDGENVGRYRLLPSREFVDFRKEAIKSGGSQEVYEQERIGVRQIGEVPIATILPAGLYTLNTIYNVYLTERTVYDIRFVLGILNSRLIAWYWRTNFFDEKRTFPKVKKAALLSVPIPDLARTPDGRSPNQDRLTGLVTHMLDLQSKLGTAKTNFERDTIEQEIRAANRQIDELVYDMYGLTEEEVRSVEEAATR